MEKLYVKNGLLVSLAEKTDHYRGYDQTFDNDVVEGFKLSVAARSSTSNNSKAMIIHPYGFSFPINTPELVSLITQSKIDNGMFIGSFRLRKGGSLGYTLTNDSFDTKMSITKDMVSNHYFDWQRRIILHQHGHYWFRWSDQKTKNHH